MKGCSLNASEHWISPLLLIRAQQGRLISLCAVWVCAGESIFKKLHLKEDFVVYCASPVSPLTHVCMRSHSRSIPTPAESSIFLYLRADGSDVKCGSRAWSLSFAIMSVISMWWLCCWWKIGCEEMLICLETNCNVTLLLEDNRQSCFYCN